MIYVSQYVLMTMLLYWLLTLKYADCRTVRAISSDRGKVVSGSDDQPVIVWDKQTSQLLEELKGHDAQVCLCRAS